MTSLVSPIITQKLENLSIASIPEDTTISFPNSHPIPLKDLLPRKSSLGQLSIIPTELLCLIIQHIDLQSLGELRLINYASKQVLDNTFEYRNLREHASDVVRALKACGALHYHTLKTIHEALTSETCAFCSDFGPCLFILTGVRCCINCIARHPALRLIPLQYANIYYRLSQDHIRDLKSIRVIPGQYRCRAHAGRMSSGCARDSLIQASEVEERAIAIYGERESLDWLLSSDYWHAKELFGSGIMIGDNPLFAHYPKRKPGYSPNDDQFYPSPLDWFRFTGSVGMPAVNQRTGTVEKGRRCLACGNNAFSKDLDAFDESRKSWTRWPMEFARSFDRSQFLTHVEQCDHAMKFWKRLAHGKEG